MTGAFEHGKTYTVISYFYPDTRPNAPAAMTSETFTFERGKGEWFPASYDCDPDDIDTLYIGLTKITVRRGWLWREVMTGQYDTTGVRPRWKEPTTDADPAAAPPPATTPTT